MTNPQAQATKPRVHPFYSCEHSAKITTVSAMQDGLEILFDDQKPAQRYTWFWLKDHGVDAGSIDYETLQRKTDTFSISADLVCTRFDFDKQNQLIDIQWNDGQASTVTAYLLASVIGRSASKHELAPERQPILWDKNRPLSELPCEHYHEVMSSQKGLRSCLENIHLYGFSLLDGVPTDKVATTQLAERIGLIQKTIFGEMWELSSELVDHGDSAYSTQYLEPHTDGTYYHDAAGLQMFNCLEFDGKGGESIQVDGFAIANQIKRKHPDAYKTLCEVSVPGHYIEPGVHLHTERPVFKLDAHGELIQVSFNNYDRAPFILPDSQSEQFHHAYGLLHRYVNDQKNWLKIPLRPGKTLIFDNWRNLHGRMGYVGKRVFYGCYHNRAEFESKLRVLQAGAVAGK